MKKLTSNKPEWVSVDGKINDWDGLVSVIYIQYSTVLLTWTTGISSLPLPLSPSPSLLLPFSSLLSFVPLTLSFFSPSPLLPPPSFACRRFFLSFFASLSHPLLSLPLFPILSLLWLSFARFL